MASYHGALAKGHEATHPLGSCETKGPHKLLAPLKRVNVILSSRSMSREKGTTRATQIIIIIEINHIGFNAVLHVGGMV